MTAMKTGIFFCFLLFLNKILQISVIVIQSELILYTKTTSFQSRPVQNKYFRTHHLFLTLLVMNISKWSVDTIITGQAKWRIIYTEAILWGKVLGYYKMYDISRQHILQISYINRNVRTLPTHRYLILIPCIWFISMERYFPMHLCMKVDSTEDTDYGICTT